MMPEILELVGIVGGMLILAAWAFETAEAVKRHKALLDLRFSLVSLVGSTLLAIYSAERGLEIFLWLNTAIAAIILFEIWYSLRVRKIHKK